MPFSFTLSARDKVGELDCFAKQQRYFQGCSQQVIVFLLSLTTSKIILKHCKFKRGAGEQPRVIKNLFPDWLLPCTYKL